MMRPLRYLLLVWALASGPAAGQERGECDAERSRAVQRLTYIVESRKESGDSVAVTLPCTNEIVVVKKCAIAGTRNRNAQRYCYPEGKPAYFELYDVLEYWEATSRGATEAK